MRLPGTARVGIFALCAGIVVYGAVYRWANSRTLLPVDMPVTLAPGHIRTGNFKINVEGFFSIQIKPPFPFAGDKSCRYIDGLQTRRLGTISGQAISTTDPGGNDPRITSGPYLGTFWSKPGNYNLEIEVLSETQSVDHCQPRLEIEADYSEYNKWGSIEADGFSFGVFCELLGISMLLVFASTQFRKRDLEELSLRIFDADAGAYQGIAADTKSKRSIPFLLIFGVFGVAAGLIVIVATMRWYDSQDFVLVDMPVSLGPGHIKTGDFSTNLKGAYGIDFEMEKPYADGCSEYAALKTHWAVMRDEHVIAHREGSGYEWEPPGTPIVGTDLYYFDAEPGTYSLDVEVLSDGRCLDVRRPRLRVYLVGADRAEYDDADTRLLLISVFSIGAGVAFLFAYGFARVRERPRALPLASSFPEQKPSWGITGLRYRRVAARRGWGTNPVMNVPTIGLVCALTWFIWLVPTWAVFAWGQRNSKGLTVSIARKSASAFGSVMGLTAPLVSIDAKQRVYLNYEETTWKELPGGLEQTLRGLPVRVVYFDCDNEIPFMDAARAIDIIEGMDAKVILVTPRSRVEK
jgi:hypothetical protein